MIAFLKCYRLIVGLYTEADARRVIEQLQERHRVNLVALSTDAAQQLLTLSGGHPGLIVALVNAIGQGGPVGKSWESWAQEQTKAEEELRKLWEGLRPVEQQALIHLAYGMEIGFREREILLLKGLIVEGEEKYLRFFTPLLGNYAVTATPTGETSLRIDGPAGLVWINGKSIDDLTAKEFDLLAMLYAQAGEVCSSDAIIDKLYPGPDGYGVSANNISSLVKRLRQKIEPNSKQPRYLLTVRGRGYQLKTNP